MYNKRYSILILLACLCLSVPVQAQINERVFMTDYRIDPEKTGELRIEFDNTNFFKNNEFDSDFLKGYSLPGFWAQFKLTYQPLENIKLEAGVHLLRYWGANKYPNYAYQDIANWKGNQYQKGFHALPFLRAQLKLSDRFDIVFGDLYGGASHRLIEPLYNPELNLMADPEAGLQMLYHSKPLDIDVWINWESFIFNMDTHQEAFTAGLSSRIKYNKEEAPLHFYSPIQVLAQHRGGEIDTIKTNSVHTLMNGAIGFGAVWNINHRIIKNINLELDATGYYQQAGELWPLDDGYGLYARASADISDFRVKTSYWRCDNFISMLGNPFYGAVSTSEDHLTFKNPQMLTFGVEYSRTFAKYCSFGIDLDVYQHLSTTSQTPEGSFSKKSSTSFSIGAYLRLNTSFLVKHFQKD
ncbi:MULTISPECIES: hypothetical protein [unclassified Parabacteroides]|uniref:hypothetical protein n=1 Tax=unclassified Parabacteroides TaxID=2649774 RepID=UPI002473C5CD|nr:MULTISPECIES: hypothetical protein [unclassified Parabacteroides]MDH6345447.1 hypothetical protein [Parabacteroides sp. PH5-46]